MSIVIPVGPDDFAWRPLLKELAEFGENIEIILSACQARPEAIHLPDNVQWLYGPQGRACQLNTGARRASKHLVWFLHADTRMTQGVKSALHRFIETDGRNLGYFRLRFTGDGPRLARLNAWGANIRARFFALPFGDQGFIVSRSVFDSLNGFDETIDLGEDLDFVVRLKAAGFSLLEMPAVLMTSARRYRQYGWLPTTLRHIGLTWMLTRQARRRVSLTR